MTINIHTSMLGQHTLVHIKSHSILGQHIMAAMEWQANLQDRQGAVGSRHVLSIQMTACNQQSLAVLIKVAPEV